MIDHTGIAVADWASATAFYDAALGALGAKLLYVVPAAFTGGDHWRVPSPSGLSILITSAPRSASSIVA